MRIALDSLDVPVSDQVLDAVDHAVGERVGSSWFAGASDLRLRLRQTKNALLCVAAVGFASGALVTSTATSSDPYEAILGALDELPRRIERAKTADERPKDDAQVASNHAAVRSALARLLART